MLPPTSVDDNVVTCHSAEHPCGASALAKLSELGAPSELGLTCDAKRRRRLGGQLQVGPTNLRG